MICCALEGQFLCHSHYWHLAESTERTPLCYLVAVTRAGISEKAIWINNPYGPEAPLLVRLPQSVFFAEGDIGQVSEATATCQYWFIPWRRGTFILYDRKKTSQCSCIWAILTWGNAFQTLSIRWWSCSADAEGEYIVGVLCERVCWWFFSSRLNMQHIAFVSFYVPRRDWFVSYF